MQILKSILLGLVGGSLFMAAICYLYGPPLGLANAQLVANHLKCYHIGGHAPQAVVRVTDQFGDTVQRVGGARLLCTPAVKLVVGGGGGL
jgi:hypothetical protein